MGKLSVKVAGQAQFDWMGDEGGIADLESAFQAAVVSDGAAYGVAAAAVDEFLSKGMTSDVGGREIHSMAIVYFLLQQDTRTAARPGKIRDYLPAWDFVFDLQRRPDGGISVSMVGTSGAWS
jgi:hypothetical protein